MVQVNFARKEISCKIVYYGPGLSGKTTNIEMVFKKTPQSHKGQLTSIATEGDRTLFFDFLPLDLGKIGGLSIKLQVYTVPGQVYYNSTRRLVLQGVDGMVFVADSHPSKEQENIESLQNLEDNLKTYEIDIKTIPLIIQFNKRDLAEKMDVALMNQTLNKYNSPTFEAVAITGEGIFPTLKAIAKAVITKINKEYFPAALPMPVAKKVEVKKPEPIRQEGSRTLPARGGSEESLQGRLRRQGTPDRPDKIGTATGEHPKPAPTPVKTERTEEPKPSPAPVKPERIEKPKPAPPPSRPKTTPITRKAEPAPLPRKGAGPKITLASEEKKGLPLLWLVIAIVILLACAGVLVFLLLG